MMFRFITLFFLIFHIACVQDNSSLFNLNSTAYQDQALYFSPKGSYSIKTFILSLTRSSLVKGILSNQERAVLSLSSLVLSDYIEDSLIQSLDLEYNRVKAFQVEYRTVNPYTNREITASGLVIMPSTSRPLPFLVYFYPTLLHKNWAPSLIPSTLLSMDPIQDYRPMLIFLALQGYIVLVPDHIGYGSSEKEPNPYLHKESTAQIASHFLQSVQNSLNEKGTSIKKELFIMGYSHGGYSALAFAKALQNSYTDFEIRAVSAGGGPYDLLYTAQELLSQKQVLTLTVAPLLQSYSYLYDWDLNDIVKKESYADTISQIYRRDNLERAVESLPSNVNSLFRSSFLDEIYSRRSNFYQQVLEENSVYDWEPDFPVLLFHLKRDDIVPYKNMEIAYHSLRSGRNSQIKKMDCSFKKVKDLIDTMDDLNGIRGNHVKMEPNHVNCTFIHFLETGDYFLNYRY